MRSRAGSVAAPQLTTSRHQKDKTLIVGKVKFYNSEGRFGYIQQDHSTEQFRVLGSALARAGIKGLREGQNVKFDTHTDPDSGRIVVDTLEIGS